MIELIEVNALNENFETHCRKGECFVEALLHALEDTPRVDAVPVVRCRDCKKCVVHRTRKNHNLMYFCSLLGANIDAPYQVNPNHFCSFGEKMDEEAET